MGFRHPQEFAGWHAWLDYAGYHARCSWEPRGSKPRVSADDEEILIAKIRALTGEAIGGFFGRTRPQRAGGHATRRLHGLPPGCFTGGRWSG
jgi:hypothetical protein